MVAYRWCDNNECLWVSQCMWSVQYSLVVTAPVAHTDSFHWDSLWLQPKAGLCVLRPHSHTFLIIKKCRWDTRSKKKRKASFWPRSDLKLIDFVFSAHLTTCVSYWAVLSSSRIWSKPKNNASQPHSSSAIGADESELYNAVGSCTRDIWWRPWPIA